MSFAPSAVVMADPFAKDSISSTFMFMRFWMSLLMVNGLLSIL